MNTSTTPGRLAVLYETSKQTDLIDVRTPAEFREMHIEFARNVPLDRLDPKAIAAERNGQAGQPLYVICRSGSRGLQAGEKLAAAGLNVVNVEGGTLAWEAAGLPVIRGKKTISLERQVRITIGLVVLTSTALAAFVHPYWIGLAALMGGGLIFSGITNFCGLALVLSRMPWNQIAGEFVKTGEEGESACCRIRKK